MKSLSALAATAVVVLLMAADPASARSREFYCGEQSVLKITAVDPKTISAGLINGRNVALKQAPGRPMTYAAGGTIVEIAPSQKSIRLTVGADEPIDCVYPVPADALASAEAAADADGESGGEQPAMLNSFAAQSWGGIVRSGPGEKFKKVASLREGEKITVLERSDQVMNGYTWFKIRYGKNKIGYQWGGILCPIGQFVVGAFQKCG